MATNDSLVVIHFYAFGEDVHLIFIKLILFN